MKLLGEPKDTGIRGGGYMEWSNGNSLTITGFCFEKVYERQVVVEGFVYRVVFGITTTDDDKSGVLDISRIELKRDDNPKLFENLRELFESARTIEELQ